MKPQHKQDKNKPSEKKLLQIRLSGETHLQIKEFASEVGFTQADVVKFSLALLKWAIEKQNSGYDIYAVPMGGGEAKERIRVIWPFK